MNVFPEYHKANSGKKYAGSVWDHQRCCSFEAEHRMLRYWAGQAVSSKGKVIKIAFRRFLRSTSRGVRQLDPASCLRNGTFAFESNQDLRLMCIAPQV